MRISAGLAIAALSATMVAAGPVPSAAPAAAPEARPECVRTAVHLADQAAVFRAPRLAPKKLTELPMGTPYMAVFRHIGGCEAPLTMVEYRNPRRR